MNYRDRKLNYASKQSKLTEASNQVIYSLSIVAVLDYLNPLDLLRIQTICKFMHDTVVPSYFANSKTRKNILDSMTIPERT